MRQIFTLLLLCAFTVSFGQVLNETFDDATGFTTSSGFFSDGNGDYLGIAGGVDDYGTGTVPSALKAYTGFTGGFLTGMDLDGEGATLPITVQWTGLDIAGLTDLNFSGAFAEFFDSPGDIDEADFILFEYQIDGGGYQNLISFVGADFSSGTNNGFFREDTNFDGTGDGGLMGDAAATFLKTMTGTGSLLDVRVSINLNSGDEDFAMDDIVITGTSSIDTTPPVITCPTNIMMDNDAGLCDAIVSFMDATATDDTDPNPTVTQTAGPASGSTFSLGDTDITFTATDAAGNMSMCTFTVTVLDAEAPVVVCAANINVDNEAGLCGAVVTYDPIIFSDNCPEPTITETTITTGFLGGNGFHGNMFDINALNNITIKSFDVNLTSASGDFEVYFKTGSYAGSEQNPGDWTLVGSVAGVTSNGPDVATPLDLDLMVSLEAGMTYAFYVTSTGADVSYTNGVTEGAVLVSNTDLEVLEGRGNEYPFLDNFSPRNFNGNIIYTTGGFGVALTSGLPSGSEFPVGTTTVTYEVTDAVGNVGSCSFDVTVNDVEDPVVTCPVEQMVDGDANDMYEIPNYDDNGLVVVTDNCQGSTISQTPAAGTMVGLGTTQVIITATDAAGNVVTCNFDVIVNELLGIGTNSLSNVSMYPNPSSGIVNVSTNVTKLKVLNLLGQIVLTTTENKFDVSSLKTGNYLVEITTNEGTATKKLIVQ
ncbi:hypothetical protein ULMS_27770 [Patiriisocius marinistellae]|uniref:HYR domain-containing protein n=1 Tax=Patiriisocius marinistellae TaxID=2494560 RepID=A0A5J4G2Z2_9FLAO|nr:HYR domain-containing protein [Patiriisocius marinistellae]GEQ87269.1 hypothetical protein ULMS_27770 [Patiriisocius marinistellae]